MNERTRAFLVIEILVFGAAALIHFGVLLNGYEDGAAGTAESVIAAVLLAGLLLGLLRPAATREAGIGSQGFALLGTCVGLVLVLSGVGPRTMLDVVLHIMMLALLVAGLTATLRTVAPESLSWTRGGHG